MNKRLLLGLPVLLCCLRALSGTFSSRSSNYGEHHRHLDQYQSKENIQCRMCHLQFPGEKCSKGRGLCTGDKEESCVTGKIFKNDGTPWLTFKGCQKNCANVNGVKWSVFLVNFRCCRSHDLCNEEY